MRIVVTGGAGFIGKHLLDWLRAAGHAVCVIDDLSTGRQSHVPAGITLIQADLTQHAVADLTRILRDFGAEGVIHLCAMHFIPDCIARPERTFQVNTATTHSLMEALTAHPVERLVLASTMDIYAVADRPHAETDVPAPANVYGLSKLLSEQIIACGVLRGACRSGVALRLANVFGPDETNPHLIPDVVDRITAGEGSELVMGYLGATRDFVFVREVADAFGRAVTQAPPGMHRLNVGTGQGVPVRMVIQTLQRLMGDTRPVHENKAAFRTFDRVSLTPEVEAIRQTLGWTARMTLEQGLRVTVDTIRAAAAVAA